MRQLGIDQLTIASYWKAEGMCHLEYCSPVYSGALTKQHQRDLARVHKRAVAAITGFHTRGEEFGETCRRLGLEEDLSLRRLRLAQKFASRTVEKSRHQDIFERLDSGQPPQHQEWRQGVEGSSLPHQTALVVSPTLSDKTPEWRD